VDGKSELGRNVGEAEVGRRAARMAIEDLKEVAESGYSAALVYSAILVPSAKNDGIGSSVTCRIGSSVGLSRFEPFHRRFIVQLNPDLCPER
jgi:hypothetical protein